MEYFYSLQTTSRQIIRKILQALVAEIKLYSSLFKLGDRLYIVLSTNRIISAKLLAKIKLFSNNGTCLSLLDKCTTSNYPGVNSSDFINLTTSANQILINWAISELKQDVNFIKFENNATPTDDGCYINCNGKQIIRSFEPLTEIMLIINNTPDSFSEAGKYYQQIDAILYFIEKSLQDGASIIDIGAEATNPLAKIIDETEEIERLVPLINEIIKLKTHYQFKLSLDSYKPAIIRHFINKIDIINDVTGNLQNSLIRIIADYRKTYICMHSLTIPANKNILISQDIDPITTLIKWGNSRLAQLHEFGLKPEQIILDPGIGFNKTFAQSWYLLKNISKLRQLGVELLVGHSRKNFLSKITNRAPQFRDLETAEISRYLCSHLVDYIRLHEINNFQRIFKTANQLTKFSFY